MSAATPISDAELVGLFAGLERTPLALAVSGGADVFGGVAANAAGEDRLDVGIGHDAEVGARLRGVIVAARRGEQRDARQKQGSHNVSLQPHATMAR